MYIRVIKDMYDGGMTSVRTPGGVTNDFPVVMGLYQGSAISRFQKQNTYIVVSVKEKRRGQKPPLMEWQYERSRSSKISRLNHSMEREY